MTSLPRLVWHPKPFGPGDIDGTGTQRLLGQPHLSLVDLLVRETAQNSWDARLDDTVPEFEIRLRTLSPEQMQVLRNHVFTDTSPRGELSTRLQPSRQMDVIEVVDRGTKGLGGDLRIDRDAGGPRHWVDFVLAVGAPPRSGSTAGGTYGFGKTAAYVASACATVLIWTATRHQGRIEHRFIGSAINTGFSMEGRRYTGRQWWGRPGTTDIEPVVGEEARLLGETLFERHFNSSETGTSLLILVPTEALPDDADQEEATESWADQLPNAIVRNLWPKLIRDQDDRYCMRICVFDNGTELPLVTSNISPTLAALERCLQSVRDGDSGTDPFLRRYEVRTQRPKQLIGHLALTRFRASKEDPLDLAESLTFMRSPELVVKTQLHQRQRQETISWVGVFKPLDEHDRAFAAAEPPAHDEWSPQSVLDKQWRRSVNVSLREIKILTSDFLEPKQPNDRDTSSEPTAALSARLAALAGPTIGARPTHGQPSGATRSTPRRASQGVKHGQVDILSVVPLQRTSQDIVLKRERSRVSFTTEGVSGEATLRAAHLRIAIEGGRLPNDSSLVHLERWLDPSKSNLGTGEELTVTADLEGSVDVSYPMGMAVEITLEVGAP